MVLPLIGRIAGRFAVRPALTAIARKSPAFKQVATTIGKKTLTGLKKIGISAKKKPVKTGAVVLGGAFLTGSPTATKEVAKAPFRAIKKAREKGKAFEKGLQEEPEDSAIRKAVKFGVPGVAAGAGLLALKKRRDREPPQSPIVDTKPGRTSPLVPGTISRGGILTTPGSVKKSSKKTPRAKKPTMSGVTQQQVVNVRIG